MSISGLPARGLIISVEKGGFPFGTNEQVGEYQYGERLGLTVIGQGSGEGWCAGAGRVRTTSTRSRQKGCQTSIRANWSDPDGARRAFKARRTEQASAEIKRNAPAPKCYGREAE